MDLSTLLGTGGGLLTPEQQGDVNSQTLMGIGAGLLKASGPSPYKPGMTTLSGIGDALQGGLATRRQAQQDALSQALVRAKTLEGLAPLLKVQSQYQALGVPLPENYQRVIDAATGLIVPGGGRPSTPAGVPAGAPEPPNLVVKAAKELGISPYSLIPGNPGADVANKRIEEYLKNTAPDQDAAAQRQKVLEQETTAYGHKYQAFQALGATSAGLYDLGEQAKAIMDRPDFASSTGFGADTKLAVNRLLIALGADPSKAFSAESFNKVFSEALQSRIEAAKETSSELGAMGKQYLAQLQIMAKASPSTENSLATNRYLVDQMQREAKKHMAVAGAASDYVINSPKGRLDPAWDKKHIELLGKPTYSGAELGGITSGQQLPGSPAPPPAPPQATSLPSAASGVLPGTEPAMSGMGPASGVLQPPQAAGTPPVSAAPAPAPAKATGLKQDPKTGQVYGLIGGRYVPVDKYGYYHGQ